jgi:diguanylate cyclase (GGDEF)-like protein
MPISHRRSSGSRQSLQFRTPNSSDTYIPRNAAQNRQRHLSEEALVEKIASGLRAEVNELGHILDEVHVISNKLKSDAPDTLALTNLLVRALEHVLEQSQMDSELRSLALTDDLTGLQNRRGFVALATQQLRLALRNREGLLLFFVDVDNLKETNDNFGHHEGDLVLRRVADALTQTFRDSDILARLAGDEFAVLAADTSSQDQDVMLRRLEQSLMELQAHEIRYDLSVSVGMVRFDPRESVSLEELLARADEAMYENKRKQPKFWQN